MPADLPALAERLRQAEEPSRELDAELALALGWERKLVTDEPAPGWYWRTADWSWTLQDYEHPPAYTSSIDSAVALLRMVEPTGEHWSWSAGESVEEGGDPAPGRTQAHANIYSRHGTVEVQAEAATPALALCLALVEWRIAHGGP